MNRVLLSCILWLASAALAQIPLGKDQQARAAAPQAFTINYYVEKHSFNSDGTGARITESQVKVLSPAGVELFGQLRFGYNADSEQLSIDYVRVRKPDGQVVVTQVEKAPEVSLEISKGAPMYTDYREKHVSVAALSPGDTLEYKATAMLQHPLAANQFWLSYSFNKEADVQDERLILEVPKASTVKIKSGRAYATDDKAGTRTYTWKSSNTPQEKPKNGTEDPDVPLVPDVQISTFQSWTEVAKWYDSLQHDRIQPNPELTAKAAELTKGAAGPEEKARRIYAFVSKSVRYVSLSFGIGRYQPHTAAEVLHNEYGDCKDKHSLLAALLQGAGISSRAVLIHTSNDLDPDVPAPSQFDHVITAAEIDGKTQWLDATTGVAPFGLLLPLMRGKQALMVAPALTDPLVITPDVSPVTSGELDEVEGSFDEAGNLEANFKISMRGDNALIMRIVARQIPQANWNDLVQRVSYGNGFGGDVSEAKIENVESPELPLLVIYRYSRKSYFAADQGDSSTGRNSLPLPAIALDPDVVPQLKKGQQLKLRGPINSEQKVKLKFAGAQRPTTPISVALSRDYGKYDSKYAMKGNELFGERSLAITAVSLPTSRTKDLLSFLTAIEQDKEQKVAVKLVLGAVAAGAELSTDSTKLSAAASARLEAGDYTGAEQLALKATQADPQSPDAWNRLGLAYLGQEGHLDQAEKAFRKQIEINPYDEYAYNNLGRVLRVTKRNDEAITAFRKQIEVAPLDKYAHKNLGSLLVELTRFQEAVPELEKAVQITPDDTQAKVLLARAYMNSGQKEKGDAMITAITPRSSFSGLDLYKSSLREDEDPETVLAEAGDALRALERTFELNSTASVGRLSATVVPASWAAKGWAYFRMDKLEDAERHLRAAWIFSQSAVVGGRLAQVYEKQNKKELALRTYVLALAAEGNKDGIRERLLRLAGSEAKIRQLESSAGSSLSTARTTVLHRRPGSASSAHLRLTFSRGQSPEKVVFTGGATTLFDKYEAAIKAQKFPIEYPDETPQHFIREALLFCGAAGCSVVFVPPPSNPPANFRP